MGRELKRKQAKREGKNVKEVQKKNAEKPMDMKTFVTILIALVLCFIILYILTGLFITKDIKWFEKKSDNETTETNITNKILGVDSLRQQEEEYYVYFYDTTSEDVSVTGVVNNLSSKVYRVNLNDDFNANFIGEPSGVTDDINNLKVSSPTVIKVVSEKITEYYNGKEEITTSLK